MARNLLAALLLNANRVVSSGQLVDVLWGDDPPVTAVGSLHNHVMRLRAFLAAGQAGKGPERAKHAARGAGSPTDWGMAATEALRCGAGIRLRT